MKLFRKIDTTTGNFIEDVLLSDNYNGSKEYISTPVPGGFYLPRWNGMVWVEGGQAPEPQPQGPTTGERLAAIETALLFLM